MPFKLRKPSISTLVGCGGVFPDAFPKDWGQVCLWVNPPFFKIVWVIHKLKRDRAKAILIVPFLPHLRYIKDLGELARKIWIIPPTRNKLN